MIDGKNTLRCLNRQANVVEENPGVSVTPGLQMIRPVPQLKTEEFNRIGITVVIHHNGEIGSTWNRCSVGRTVPCV